jgi:hypothetical protein
MPIQNKITMVTHGDITENERRKELVQLIKDCPIPQNELLLNMGMFLTPQTLSRILFMDFLYKQILDVQGVIVEFGCRWGQNLSLFSALRGIYEPFNRLRKVIGFDTFAGLHATTNLDGKNMKEGAYSVTPNYQSYLTKLLSLQELESPQAHIKKHEIIKGDASREITRYLKRNPETIISLAFFDMDIYKPTYECLTKIRPFLTRGSILGFDELNDHACPGETLALRKVFGLNQFPIRRFPFNARTSYIVIDKPIARG